MENIDVTSSMMKITDQEFRMIQTLIYERCGINLTEQKRSLVVGRLQKFVRHQGFTTFREYYDYVVSEPSGKALIDMVDKISTNFTYFNREKDHFDFLSATALPDVVDRIKRGPERDLRIWCAGCSSGEEAYMLIMLLMEYFGEEYGSWNAGLLATDISTQVLSFAMRGVYPEDRLTQLPEKLRKKYFTLAGDGQWAVAEKLKREITFRQFNLMTPQFPFKKQFHIIFCRNVMIYFDRPTRDALVGRFHANLRDGGYFFIGHSETLGRDQTLFKYLKPALYQKLPVC